MNQRSLTAYGTMVLALLAIAQSACGPGDADEVWTIAEDWRVGAIEGAPHEQFGALGNLAIGPRGEVAVVDFQAQDVRVFDARGRFLHRVGGPGGGPGEFDGPIALAWDAAGRLWIVDGWNLRYSVFDDAGELVRTIPRAVRPAGFRQILAFDDDGALLDETRWVDARGSRLALVRVDTTGAVLDTFPPLDPSSSGWPPATPSPPAIAPFFPTLVYALAPDRTLWFASSTDYRLYQRTLAGDTLRVIETSHRDASLRAADERRIRDELARRGVARAGLELGRPVVQGIDVLDDGHVLVRIEAEPGEDARAWDVFDPDGRYLGELRAPFPIHRTVAPAVRGDTIVLVTRDQLDVQYVVRATIRRP